MAGIYIHIPFCSKACHYCDFHFSTNQHDVTNICKAICDELEIQKAYLDFEAIETIYFGGGTPSILSPPDLEMILNTISKNFKVKPQSEVTLEANPEDLSYEKACSLKEIGINRLSIGVQSFNDEVLRFLNRSHSGEQASLSIINSRKAGFTNSNVDLIYAIPNRNDEKLIDDLTRLTSLNPEHISAYSLTIEEKTVFGKWTARKDMDVVSDASSANQYEIIKENLSVSGFDQYEISNYAKPGFESHHNSNYWKQKKYLGVGPSAHSYNGVSRQANISNNSTYLKSIQSGSIPATVETLKREDHVNEYLMTSLRTKWGCDLNYLKTNHQFDLVNNQKNLIDSGVKNGLMNLDGNILTLTNKGKMHADKLSSDLFLIN